MRQDGTPAESMHTPAASKDAGKSLMCPPHRWTGAASERGTSGLRGAAIIPRDFGMCA